MERTSFTTCKIKNIIRETGESVSIIFEIPEEKRALFQYQAGQYLTLRKDINGEDIRRSYSLSTSPHTGVWRIGVKQVPEGKFSTYLNQHAVVGDEIEVMPPTGNFLLKEDNEKSTYVFFAAGSGITPILSMISQLLEKSENEVILFYGNKSVDKVMYRGEIENLKNKYMQRFTIHYVFSQEKLGSPLFLGRINGSKCKEYHKFLIDQKEVAQYLLCGPAPMIFSVEESLLERGIPKDNISYELFTTTDIPKKDLSDSDDKTIQQLKGNALSKIKIDGLITEITIPYTGKSILEMAMDSGLDVPFSCKGGVCCTCKAKLIKGSVNMEVNYALEDEEVEAGFILTCQSHPQTPEIFVDYDQV
jgi:ring-1,2-phenylacetyl-CoA epoxidase subunit PaaE